GTKVDERRAKLTSQQLLKLGAVNQDESRSPPLRHHLPRDAQQPRAIRPLNPLPGQLHRQLRHLASQPDRRQRRQRVRPQAHPPPPSSGACKGPPAAGPWRARPPAAVSPPIPPPIIAIFGLMPIPS